MSIMQHRTAVKYKEYLNSLSNSYDTVEVMSEIDSLLANPSKSRARDMLIAEMELWMDSNFSEFIDDKMMRKIAERIGY